VEKNRFSPIFPRARTEEHAVAEGARIYDADCIAPRVATLSASDCGQLTGDSRPISISSPI